MDTLKSDQSIFRVFALSCGQGDTTFVHFPNDSESGGKWLLIDCRLPRHSQAEREFFAFVERERITKLDMLILTHPDQDHCLGMDRVIEYFTSGSRQLSFFYACTPQLKSLYELMARVSDRNGRPFAKRRDAFGSVVAAIVSAKQRPVTTPRIRVLNHDQPCIDVKLSIGAATIVPLSPVGDAEFQELAKLNEAIEQQRVANLDVNAMSIVVAIAVNAEQPTLSIFPGDIPSQLWDDVLKRWESRSDEMGTRPADWVPCGHAVDLMKIPHHGASSSHDDVLVRRGSLTRQRYGLLSVGLPHAGYRHPRRSVLKAYFGGGFQIISTAARRDAADARQSVVADVLDWRHRDPDERNVTLGRRSYKTVNDHVDISLLANGSWRVHQGAEILVDELDLYSD